MVTKDIKVSYGKRFDTGGCAYDQMLSIRLKSAEMLKLEASIKEISRVLPYRKPRAVSSTCQSSCQ